ncbi:hypothetical protein WNY81_20555 [Shewanella frigidimarina]
MNLFTTLVLPIALLALPVMSAPFQQEATINHIGNTDSYGDRVWDAK